MTSDKQNQIASLQSQLKATCKAQGNPDRISSGMDQLDQALGGGFPLGCLCEWGMPPGKKARNLLTKLLAHNKPLCLWIYTDQDDSRVYPPAWAARGVDLGQTYFVKSSAPLSQLRPAFLEPLFPIIVIDSFCCHGKDELAFLSRQSRALSATIFLIRPYLLSHAKGNPFAKNRLNSWLDYPSNSFHIHLLRGLSPKILKIPAERPYEHT
ncbi:MAG: hypothetical protein HRU09_13375 [Oligoflexales bacterium]|nr:hypothetical protein [Oligoflexales bacterium]